MPQSYLPCQTEWFAPVSFCEKNHEKRKKSDAAPDARKKAVPKAPNFGTLHAVRNLKNAEFGDKQAVTLVETLQDAQSELATRADVENTELALRTDLEKTGLALRTDLEKTGLALRTDMERMESGIRGDMERMESGIRHDMEKMESGIRHDMEKMESGIRGDMEKMELGIRGDMEKMELGIRGDMEARFSKLSRQILASASGATAVGTSIISLLILFK